MARPPANASSSSWVVDMEKMLEHTDPSAEAARWKKSSIYRVPERIKHQTNKTDAYRPELVSLGPFHHGKRHLIPMEEHKRRAVLHLVKRARVPLQDLAAAVEETADELLEAYDSLDEWWCGAGRGRFVEVMLTDGCFLLEMMRTGRLVLKGKPLKDYAPNDPVFSIHGFYFLRPDIKTDMILMENQLPLLVLRKILAVARGTSSPSAEEINQMVLRFLDCPLNEGIGKLGLHPLELYHKCFRDLQPNVSTMDRESEDTVPSAVELSEAGIYFKKSATKRVCDIDFQDGELRMPLVTVYDETEKNYLNMMAFELLHRYAGNDVTDYIIFMDNIINSERDVALLRSKGLIKSGLGSDVEVAELFNTLSKGAVMSPFCKLLDVQKKMNEHCRKRWNKWRAIFKHTYLSNPWVFISLVAATVLLIATLMQTIYAVMPFYTKN